MRGPSLLPASIALPALVASCLASFSLGAVCSGLTHVVARVRILFLFRDKEYSIAWMDLILCIHLWTSGLVLPFGCCEHLFV